MRVGVQLNDGCSPTRMPICPQHAPVPQRNDERNERRAAVASSETNDARRLQTLRALRRLKLNLLALFEGTESGGLDC